MSLIYTYTDGLIIKFQTPDIYHDLLKMKDQFKNSVIKRHYKYENFW